MPLGPDRLDDDDKPIEGINWYHHKGLGAAGAEIVASVWTVDDAGVLIGTASFSALDAVSERLRASVEIDGLPAGAGTYLLTNKATFDTGEVYSKTIELIVLETV